MKKIIILVSIFILFIGSVFASDYDSLYENAQPFQSKLYNDIDPYEDEDSIKYAWSPYPLFRTSADLYFKDYKIEAGYYILTPRTLSGKDYILFKQNGKVQFIIPVAKKESTPMNFYEANIPQPKLTMWQSFCKKVRKKFYDTATDAKRITPPNSLVNVDVDSKYILLNMYYGEDKFVLVFKRTPY